MLGRVSYVMFHSHLWFFSCPQLFFLETYLFNFLYRYMKRRNNTKKVFWGLRICKVVICPDTHSHVIIQVFPVKTSQRKLCCMVDFSSLSPVFSSQASLDRLAGIELVRNGTHCSQMEHSEIFCKTPSQTSITIVT